MCNSISKYSYANLQLFILTVHQQKIIFHLFCNNMNIHWYCKAFE